MQFFRSLGYHPQIKSFVGGEMIVVDEKSSKHDAEQIKSSLKDKGIDVIIQPYMDPNLIIKRY